MSLLHNTGDFRARLGPRHKEEPTMTEIAASIVNDPKTGRTLNCVPYAYHKPLLTEDLQLSCAKYVISLVHVAGVEPATY